MWSSVGPHVQWNLSEWSLMGPRVQWNLSEWSLMGPHVQWNLSNVVTCGTSCTVEPI